MDFFFFQKKLFNYELYDFNLFQIKDINENTIFYDLKNKLYLNVY